jgi:hypothetical protein
MAIVIRGRTACGICREVIGPEARIKMFSAFVGNELDPLMKFHDAVFHEACFLKDPLAGRAEARWVLMQAAMKDRSCGECGRKIDHPDDYFIFDFMAEDAGQAAFPFNRLQFHESCLRGWPRLEEALKAVFDLRESGAYRGKSIDCMIEVLRKAASP